MRRRVALAGAAALLLTGCAALHQAVHHAQSGPRRLGSGQCKPGPPLAGVYLPFRLHVRNGCMTVSGTVDCVRHEDDGDIHFGLRVDPAYRHLLTPANAFQQCPGHSGSHLVVEIIPQHGHLPFLTNSATVGGFQTPAAPAVGQHITVTGPYVWDTNALHDLAYPGKNVANWAEIHPAWNVTVQRR
ncbi:MAG TPA: hypothetical protein VF070_47360 [Streptosporangiaceae bacterium]